MQFDPHRRNYACQTVEIPPGTVLYECNFGQHAPGTSAISCDGALHFINCNLVNVLLDTRWSVSECNTAQIWFVEKTDAKEAFDQAEVTRLQALSGLLTEDEWLLVEPTLNPPATTWLETTLICSHPHDLPDILIPPEGALK